MILTCVYNSSNMKHEGIFYMFLHSALLQRTTMVSTNNETVDHILLTKVYYYNLRASAMWQQKL